MDSINALYTIVGILLGSVITYWFQMKRDIKHLRLEVYTEFLDALAKNATLKTEDSIYILASKLAKICLVGSKDVIENVAGYVYDNTSDQKDDPTSNKILFDMVDAMRKDLNISQKTEEGNIYLLLIGRDDPE